MINETIILLTYYSRPEDAEHPVLRHIIKTYSPAYLPWDMYLADPLRKIFSRVIAYDFLRRRAEIGIEAMNAEIIELVRKEKARYVLWTSYYYDVHQSTLDTLRKEGKIVVGWFFDDEWRFDTYSRYWIPHLDYCVTNSIETIPRYEALNARVISTVPNTGIAIDRRGSDVGEKYGVTFVGSTNFVDRKQHINRLKERGIPVQLFGGGSGGYVSFNRMIETFQTSKINLNFSKVGYYHRLRQIKGRVFQVCLAGGFLLTESTPGLEKYFEIGKELDCFEDADEMAEKISYYLEHDAERRAIAHAGWERATREYTSDSMVAKVFQTIEMDRGHGKNENLGRNHRQPVMPLWTRTLIPSHYQFHWGKAFLEEGCPREQWQGSLVESLKWSLINLPAWYVLAVGNLPRAFHQPLLRANDAVARLPGIILRKLCAMPVVGSTIRSMVKRFV